MTKYLILFVTVIQLFIFGACKSSSDTPAVTETKSANVEVSSFLVVSERDEASNAQAMAKMTALTTTKGDSSAGYVYNINLSVAETIGGNATITSVEFDFYNSSELFGSFTPDVTSVFSSTKITGGGTLTATEQRVASDADFPYADEIQVIINYTDEKGASKTATATYYGPQYEDADLIVAEGSVSLSKFFNTIIGYATIQNLGTRAASNYTVIIYFYDSTGEWVNLMIHEETDPLAAYSTVTIADYLSTSWWSDIKSYTWRISWTKADGTSMVKNGQGTL